MARVTTEVEFDELYRDRKLRVLWRLSRGWTLVTASVQVTYGSVNVFIRQDQPAAPVHIRKLSFKTAHDCDDYVTAKRLELEGEGWRGETG